MHSYMGLVGPGTMTSFRPGTFPGELTALAMVPLRLVPQFALARGAGQIQTYFFEHTACCHLPKTILNYTCTRNISMFHADQRPFVMKAKLCCNGEPPRTCYSGFFGFAGRHSVRGNRVLVCVLCVLLADQKG